MSGVTQRIGVAGDVAEGIVGKACGVAQRVRDRCFVRRIFGIVECPQDDAALGIGFADDVAEGVVFEDGGVAELILDDFDGVGRIVEQLDDISDETSGSFSGASSKPTFGDKVREFFAGISGANKNPRRIGEHAVDALEARLWEVQLDDFALQAEMLTERPIKLEQHDEFLDAFLAKKDLSYEYAKAAVYPRANLSFVQYDLLHDLSQLALKIMELYPSATSLPKALPEEMLPEDPFSTDNVLYKKTATGFIVYSVYTNGTDDGYPLHDPDRYLLKNADISRSSSGLDFGIVLNYEIPIVSP